MADACERCGAALDGAGNHLELETADPLGDSDPLALRLCDACAWVAERVVRDVDVAMAAEVHRAL